MALPASLQTVEVRIGPYYEPDGRPLVGGRVQLTPEWPIVHATTGAVILGTSVTIVTGVDGTGRVVVPASDAAGVTRRNFRYLVAFQFPGGPASDSFYVRLRAADPHADLDLLAPVTGPDGGEISVPAVTSIAGYSGAVTGEMLAESVAFVQAFLDAIPELPSGDHGEDGAPGLSAFQLAVNAGYTGTLSQWLTSLRGPAGNDGVGTAGKSAYQAAVDSGFVGDVAAWLVSLRGTVGQSAYQLAVAGGFTGSEAAWITSLKGVAGLAGKSAYELAVANGFSGDLTAWLLSLRGPAGSDGKSAYELAVAGGYSGTLSAWLLSLKGTPGTDAAVTATNIEANLPTRLTDVSLSAKFLPRTEYSPAVAFKSYTYDAREFVQAGETLAKDGTVGNNSAILQRAFDALTAGTKPRLVFLPDGDYMLADSGQVSGARYGVRVRTRVGLVGESTRGTVILSDATSTPIFGAYGPQLDDVTFRTFTVDCAAQTNATYTTQLKGMFIQDMLRPHWDRTVIKNSWGTGLGCDYLRDYRIDNHMSLGCGRGIIEKGADPLAVSGGSGIGIGTGKYQDERGVITAPLLLGNGKNGLFYETQASVTYHSRGHSVVGGVAAGNHTGLHDCGCDGLDVAGLELIDNAYAGLLLAGTILEPNAGYNGRFDGLIARNGSVNNAQSGGVVIGSAPSGRYVIEGVVSGNNVGINARPDAKIGPGLRIAADIRDNLGAGVALVSSDAGVVKGLTVSGRVLSNGRSIGSTRREGVVIGVPTKNLQVTAQIGDDQDTPTQQVGLYLKGAGLACASPRITSDLRGNVLPFSNEQTLTDLAYSGVGATLTDPSALIAAAGDGQVNLSWGAPVSSGDVTDYRVEYRLVGAGTWSTAARTASPSLAHTVTGLTNGSAYEFRVAALRSAALSGYTNTAGATPSVASGAIVYSDTFDRADSGTDPGTGWNPVTGTWGILSNKLHLYSTSTARELIRTAARPSANHGISFLPTRGNSVNVGGEIRRLDANNYYGVRINASNSIALTKTIGGTSSVVGAEKTFTAGQRVGVEVYGSTLRLLLDNVVVDTVTVTESTLASATTVGLRATGGTTPPDYDDFLEYNTTS